jgi:DNA helicase-2/ATP-dependent DNA helicase PcrA
MEPSRYYRDIPVEVRAQEGENMQIRSAGSSNQRLQQWQDLERSEQAAPKQEREYKPGTRVRHPTWGEGLVINSKLQDDDEVVDIFFEGEGKKKVLASLADLEVLD